MAFLKKTRLKHCPLIFYALFLFSPQAFSLPNYSPGADLSGVTRTAVDSLIETIGFGLDHRAYMSATPMGWYGFDIGFDITGVNRPTAFVNALQQAGVTATIPATVYFPRFNVHKGLPAGFDIGMSYLGYQGNEVVGGDIKYSFMDGKGLDPALALRASKNWVHVFFMSTQTEKLDLVISKPAAKFFDPYFGLGMQWVHGQLDVPFGGLTGLQVEGSHTKVAPHGYFGLPIRLLFGRIDVEYDYSAAGISVFGTKISLAL